MRASCSILTQSIVIDVEAPSLLGHAGIPQLAVSGLRVRLSPRTRSRGLGFLHMLGFLRMTAWNSSEEEDIQGNRLNQKVLYRARMLSTLPCPSP